MLGVGEAARLSLSSTAVNKNESEHFYSVPQRTRQEEDSFLFVSTFVLLDRREPNAPDDLEMVWPSHHRAHNLLFSHYVCIYTHRGFKMGSIGGTLCFGRMFVAEDVVLYTTVILP